MDEQILEKGDGWVIIRRYLHDEQEEYSSLWPIDAEHEDQQEEYHYALYEVAIDLKVDLKTGKGVIVAVDGKKVEQ